jgi:hypothetical protein
MYYEINVSKHGIHFFATAPRSITCEWVLEERLPVIVEKFPEAEGYKVTVTRWEQSGKEVDQSKYLKESVENE